MTTIDIIGLQRRMRQLGEIRIGHVIDTGKVSEKTGKPIRYPGKLDKFRITSASRHTLEEIAKLYGGTVQAWIPANGGPSEWEVYTDTDRLPVIIPPANAVSQSFEMYKGSKCVRRCDGRIETKNDQACMCDPENRACQLTTRLNVMLRDVQGLGVWLLTSHGFYAAVELPPVVEFLASTNGYVDAFLTMELKRVVLDDGKVAEFQVPKIDVAVTPAQLLAGQGAISAPAITANQDRAALTGERPAIAGAVVIEAPAQAGPDFVALIKAAPSREKVVEIWEQAKAANAPGPVVEAAARARVAELEAARPLTEADVIAAVPACETDADLTALLAKAQAAGFANAQAGKDDPVIRAFVARRRMIQAQASAQPTAQDGPTTEALWSQIISAAGAAGMDRTSEVEEAFMIRSGGVHPSTASLDELQTFLANLQAGRVQTATSSSVTSSAVDSEVPF